MKWPRARHSHTPTSPPPQRLMPEDPIGSPVHKRVRRHGDVAPSRRDWATLPPLHVAGGRRSASPRRRAPSPTGLASRQVLVRFGAPRARAPDGRAEWVVSGGARSGRRRPRTAPPELQEASPLPAVEHRQLTALAGEQRTVHGLSPDRPAAGHRRAGAGRRRTHRRPTPSHALADDRRRTRGGGADHRVGGAPASPIRGVKGSARRTTARCRKRCAPERERGDPPDHGTESVPGDMRATMRDVLGVDVGDRLVHRGPAVSAEARAMNAQAFTRDGQVHVADEVGPLDQPNRSGDAGPRVDPRRAADRSRHPARRGQRDRAALSRRTLSRSSSTCAATAVRPKPSPDLLHARPPTTASSRCRSGRVRPSR